MMENRLDGNAAAGVLEELFPFGDDHGRGDVCRMRQSERRRCAHGLSNRVNQGAALQRRVRIEACMQLLLACAETGWAERRVTAHRPKVRRKEDST